MDVDWHTELEKPSVFSEQPLLISPATFQDLPLRSCHWYKLSPKSGLRMDKSLMQVWPRGGRKRLAPHPHTVEIGCLRACLPV